MPGALEGLRILDMTQYEAGTSCTQMLAWLGADVVKVEPPRGDAGRSVTHDPTVFSQYFLNYNSNKRSIVVDLKSQAGRELILQMVPKYDVFVENYGPGVIEDLGLTYEVMKELNPSIIYGRIKGFGLEGPYSDYLCFDWVAQASAGAFSITGDLDGPPTMCGPTFGDSGSGMQMALAITAAYVHKQKTGEGQFIEISMQESVTMFMRTAGLRTWGRAPQPRSGMIRGSATTGIYPCAGGGANDHIFIMATTTAMWDALCNAMDRFDLLTDPRYENGKARVENTPSLYAEIQAWTMQHNKHDAMAILAAAGVPSSAVMDTHEILNDPNMTARGFVHHLQHPAAGDVTILGNPIRMKGSEIPMKGAPLLGEHTGEVLAEDLGLSADEIAGLRERGAILQR